MTASEKAARLAILRKELQLKRKEYRRAKEDFDDGDGTDEGAAAQLAEMRKELSRLQDDLQSSTAELANLAYSAFPELLAGAQGSALLPSLDYGGLLKEGGTLDDFDEPPVLLPSESRRPIWVASENGKQVVLKEYWLAEAKARASFGRELRALRRLQHPTIVELLAVLIDPKGRAYVQMPLYECTLGEWAAKAEHSQERLQQVLSEVARAL
jgi:hypothetical protein